MSKDRVFFFEDGEIFEGGEDFGDGEIFEGSETFEGSKIFGDSEIFEGGDISHSVYHCLKSE